MNPTDPIPESENIETPKPKTRWRSPKVMLPAVGFLAVVAFLVTLMTWQRMSRLQEELSKRQQESANQSMEARMVAKQTDERTREMVAKLTLAETRLADVSAQRSQLEELMQAYSRSRDESLAIDLEASIRLAHQQSQLSGSTESLLAALRSADERIIKQKGMRMNPVHLAIERDIERVRNVAVSDVASLALKLEEVARLIDALPLNNQAPAAKDKPPHALKGLPNGSPVKKGLNVTWESLATVQGWRYLGDAVWEEFRTLVRVSRIDHPEGVLIAPEQSFFLKENIKLSLLNARMALFARQFEAAKSDLAVVRKGLERYFDLNHSNATVVLSLLTQVEAQSRSTQVPRPEETFSALLAITPIPAK